MMMECRFMQMYLLLLIISTPSSVTAGLWSTITQETVEEEVTTNKVPDVPVNYGVDVSFPMHYSTVTDNYAWLEHNMNPDVATPKKYKDMVVQPLGDKQKFYDDYIGGCIKENGSRGSRCTANERDRVAMSLRQPQSMQNYTDMGFKKIRAPDEIWKLVKNFWDTNKDNAKPENWGAANTYTNNWAVPTSMVSVEDSTLRGGGRILKQKIWDAARNVIQEWTGEELTQCSLYGIRIYHEGSVLATHVDRLPLVSSAIINVAQDVDEPWPLEVYGHDGQATNVTMLPGDMVLYESHSVLHGRPFPLKGRFMANLFIHFEPTGHSLRHNAKMKAKNVDEKYREDAARGVSGHENDQTGLPSYIVPGTPEESHWRMTHPNGQQNKQRSFATGSTTAHLAAQGGDLNMLKDEITKKKHMVNAKDRNGWTPLHEGVRGGHLEVVKYLVEQGADVNQKTGGGNGKSPLFLAKEQLSDSDPVVQFLESVGALEIGPDL